MYLADGGQGRADLVVDDGVDGDGDGVLGEDLLGRHVEGDGPQVDHGDRVDARDDEEQAGADGAAALHAPETEDHGALVLLQRTAIECLGESLGQVFISTIFRKETIAKIDSLF